MWMFRIIITAVLIMGFWLMIGYGMVKITPNLYFYAITPLLFCLMVSKLIDIFKSPSKELFDLSIDILYVAFAGYLWFCGIKGIDRILQGLSPIVREPNVMDGLSGLAYGFGIAITVIATRMFYLKWRRNKKEALRHAKRKEEAIDYRIPSTR